MGTRHPNPRLIKIHRSYSVDEAARTLKVHKNTVRRWLKQGLPKIEGKGLTLICGPILRAFLEAKRQRAKRPCPAGFIYCLRCREPRRPEGREVHLTCTSQTVGNLTGRCSVCGTRMNRRINITRLESAIGDISLSRHTSA